VEYMDVTAGGACGVLHTAKLQKRVRKQVGLVHYNSLSICQSFCDAQCITTVCRYVSHFVMHSALQQFVDMSVIL
jgi:hypothetical protein